ncbi:RNase HII [Carnobacterium alterfunditum]|uniref:Ribonuclease HII n=1 Tax=Carnobacterium alterfunditum TaxID=28230 RepID=A0A1N6GX28_9LACT|nr:ribonuclease HII [Carnobacterium alterfunditum]SIO12098.1 RNase HII [Carnobacterium alterfunditum]
MEKPITIAAIKDLLTSITNPADERLVQIKNDSRKGAINAYNAWENRLKKQQSILEKQQEMLQIEHYFWGKGTQYIAGIDEVGRGPLAGPVVAAAVILPIDFAVLGINDSKQLSSAKRESLFDQIQESAIAIGVGIKDHQVVDEVNIYQATKLAMIEAVQQLPKQPEQLLIDAMHLPVSIPQESFIKGDAKSLSIAAASIIAKVTRDRMMADYDELYPGYGFSKNAGYGTKVHLEGLQKHGACPIHRKTFAPVKNILK